MKKECQRLTLYLIIERKNNWSKLKWKITKIILHRKNKYNFKNKNNQASHLKITKVTKIKILILMIYLLKR